MKNITFYENLCSIDLDVNPPGTHPHQKWGDYLDAIPVVGLRGFDAAENVRCLSHMQACVTGLEEIRAAPAIVWAFERHEVDANLVADFSILKSHHCLEHQAK